MALSSDITAQARLNKVAKLVKTLNGELETLESAHRLQFETTATLAEKLAASKRARTALTKARRISEAINETLGNHQKR